MERSRFYVLVLLILFLLSSGMNVVSAVKLRNTEQRINGMFCIEARDY